MSQMFRRVLIANRGEIAVRVMQACRDLGLETVAVFSQADRDSRHVRIADHAMCIGPPSAAKSYLHQEAILEVVDLLDVGAVHPGYGFLAENAEFAEAVDRAGATWVGPSPESIRLLGDKAAARQAAVRADVPVLPGTIEPPDSPAEALAAAEKIGFPVLLKAVSGGGGKGMRVVERARELERQFELASSEAELAFGDPRVYVERYLTAPRHVEIQVFGETVGDPAQRVVALGARECSIQRRHQKLLEEAPPAGVDPEVVRRMEAAAISLARSVDYVGAGTVEFLLDGTEFYFMEMNTRIQVEHPVTEMVTGTDLVSAQLRAAQGLPSGLPAEIVTVGHAIECRINAEDPVTFVPSPGTIERIEWPTGAGVRIDTHCFSGYRFPPFYDSLMGKIVSYGATRTQAAARMRRALSEFTVDGIRTTAPLHQRIVSDDRFLSGRLDTGYLERLLKGRAGS